MCFQNRFSRSDHQWKYGTKEIKGKTKVKNPKNLKDFYGIQNQCSMFVCSKSMFVFRSTVNSIGTEGIVYKKEHFITA